MKKLFFLFCLIPTVAIGQDTIRVGDRFERFSMLELGTKKDLVYSSMNGKVLGLSVKTRTSEIVTIDGQEYLSVKHTWQAPKSDWNGSFAYLCEPNTLRPVQHIRVTKKEGKEAFAFGPQKVTGLDSASENKKQDFDLTLATPTYNWEIDLETYSLLPMKEGYHAVMNFYHPGGQTAPGWYHLKVTGSEKLDLPDGRQMDCWIVFTDYGGTQPTRFWYTKQGQNFVKMEGQYNRVTIHKERIF